MKANQVLTPAERLREIETIVAVIFGSDGYRDVNVKNTVGPRLHLIKDLAHGNAAERILAGPCQYLDFTENQDGDRKCRDCGAETVST